MVAQRGKYYVLPFEGAQIEQINFSGSIRLVFDVSVRNYLDLTGKFRISNHSTGGELSLDSKQALLFFYDLYAAGITIKEAKADKDGRLYLTFSNNVELVMDGASECWACCGPSKQKPQQTHCFSGGLGYLDF